MRRAGVDTVVAAEIYCSALDKFGLGKSPDQQIAEFVQASFLALRRVRLVAIDPGGAATRSVSICECSRVAQMGGHHLCDVWGMRRYRPSTLQSAPSGGPTCAYSFYRCSLWAPCSRNSTMSGYFCAYSSCYLPKIGSSPVSAGCCFSRPHTMPTTSVACAQSICGSFVSNLNGRPLRPMIVTNNQLGRGTGEKGDKISTIILSFVSFSPVSLPSDPYFFLFSCHTERQITPAQGNGAGWGRPVAKE